MSFLSKIAPLSVALLLAHSALAATPRGPHEIDEDTAYHLATSYMCRYISLCGAAQDPISHRKHWYVPLRVGVGAELFGSVRIDKLTGVISYRGKTFADQKGSRPPTTTARALEIWAKAPDKPHRSP
jgi:hypothetical protein